MLSEMEAILHAHLTAAEDDRDRYRALLEEFDSHRADSSVEWIDDWSRRVSAALRERQADES
jgi:hypothetical protein